MSHRPYTTADVAALLGVSVDRFNRSYARRVRDDGMPPALSSFGPRRFARRPFDAWLNRARALDQAPANDAEELLSPDWTRVLADAYGAGR